MYFFSLDNTNSLNAWMSNIMASVRNPVLTHYVVWLTNLGSPTGLSILALLLAMVLWSHGKVRHMIQLVLTLSFGALAVTLIKHSVQLPRPLNGLIPETGYSFVSGHATYACIFFTLIFYSYKSHVRSGLLRWLFVAVNIFCALLVGMSRLYLGVHYFTDVLGGFILGAVVSALSILMFERYEAKHPTKHP